MAMQPWPTQAAAPHAVLVLCGIPGSGKTTLAAQLARTAPAGLRVQTLTFDDALLDAWAGSACGFSPALWRGAREQSFYQLDFILRDGLDDAQPASECFSAAGQQLGQRRSLVIVDDNMYYR